MRCMLNGETKLIPNLNKTWIKQRVTSMRMDVCRHKGTKAILFLRALGDEWGCIFSTGTEPPAPEIAFSNRGPIG